MLEQNESSLAAELQEIRAELAVCQELARYRELDARRLWLERRLGELRHQEHAVVLNGLPLASGFRYLVLTGYFVPTVVVFDLPKDDSNVGKVVFEHCVESRFGGLNDEVFEAHALYGRGLDTYGFFQVHHSSWKAELRAGMATHRQFSADYWETIHHYILRNKEGEFACLARGFSWSIESTSMDEVLRRFTNVC